MAFIGYARVSTRDQNSDAQTYMLSGAGSEELFGDHASGKLAQRPALTKALRYLRNGDTLVVKKLDRLDCSVKNLKEVSDELQNRGIGLKALSQGIDTTTPGAVYSSTGSPRSQNSSTISSLNERETSLPLRELAAAKEVGGRK